MSRHSPNERALRAGDTLAKEIAPLVTLALVTLTRDSQALGYPTTSSTSGRTTGSHGPTITVPDEHGKPDRIPVTSVEAAAFRLDQIADHREELRDRLDGLEVAVNSFANFLRRTIGPEASKIPELCNGSRSTLERKAWEGHQLVWTPNSRDDRNGWHKPECRESAGPSGLCPACLLRMNRWRARNGLDWVTEGRTAA